MTIDYKALAERLRKLQAGEAYEAATLIERMAQEKPAMWVQSNHLSWAGKQPFMARCAPSQLHPDFVPLYAHPAPQPQPVLSGYGDYGAAIPGIERPCTCHPDDNPPVPCTQKYALNECRAASDEPTEMAAARPVAWTLRETLEKRDTAFRAPLWFVDPINSAWVPLYTHPAPQPQPEPTEAQHPDDAAVDRFAAAMKAKLAEKRAEGRGGWDGQEQCSTTYLAMLLRGHVGKGDPLDVGNFAMMLWNRGGATNEAIDAGIPDLRLTEAQIEWPARADEGMLRAMIGWRECDGREGLSGEASMFDRVYHALYSHMRDRAALAAKETK